MQAAYIERPIHLYSVLETAAAKSVAPSLDFEWEPFAATVTEFLFAFDGYVTESKAEIAQRANAHSDALKHATAEQSDLEKRTALEREREALMLQALEQERHTVHDLTSTLTHIQTTLSKVKDQSKALEEELNAVKRAVQMERSEKERQARALDAQRGRDSLELQILQDVLGLRIEGVNQNSLLVRFTLIDPNDPDREFSLLIDISGQAYSVPKCDPPINNMAELVAHLNDDRDLYGFIKRARKQFRATLPSLPAPSSVFDDLSGPGRAQ